MRAMRSEGTAEAATATAISAAATLPNTTGSVGRTLYSMVVMSRVIANAPATPIPRPMAASRTPWRITQRGVGLSERGAHGGHRLRIVCRRLDHHVHGARRRLLVVPVHLAALAGVRQFQGPYGAHYSDHRIQSVLGLDSAVDVAAHRLAGWKVFPCQELVHDYDLLGVRRIALAEVASGAQRYFHGRQIAGVDVAPARHRWQFAGRRIVTLHRQCAGIVAIGEGQGVGGPGFGDTRNGAHPLEQSTDET